MPLHDDAAPARPPGPDARALPASAPVRGLRALVLAALLALVLLGLAWEWWLAPTGRGTLALKVLPLVACVAGVLRHRLYTYRVLALLVWLYVLEGSVRAAGDAGLVRTLALAEVALAVALFAACAAYVRTRLRGATRPAAA
jgi:uncharacterized membrane protein